MLDMLVLSLVIVVTLLILPYLLWLLDKARLLLLRIGMDIIQLWIAAESAILDVKQRESEIEMAQLFGQMQIKLSRKRLTNDE